MSQMYRTLWVAPSDEGVLSVVIHTPPMKLIGPELVRERQAIPIRPRNRRRARPHNALVWAPPLSSNDQQLALQNGGYLRVPVPCHCDGA